MKFLTSMTLAAVISAALAPAVHAAATAALDIPMVNQSTEFTPNPDWWPVPAPKPFPFPGPQCLSCPSPFGGGKILIQPKLIMR